MFRHGHWIYADSKDGLPSVPCLLVLLLFVVFLSICSTFVTENQLQVSNKLMEHGTNGTTCHQEHLGLNEEAIAGRSKLYQGIDDEDQTMTNRDIIMVSVAIECEAVAQCMWHVFVKRFMMIQGPVCSFVYLKKEEMNNINYDDSTLCMQNKYWVVLNFAKNLKPATGTTGRCIPDVLWGRTKP